MQNLKIFLLVIPMIAWVIFCSITQIVDLPLCMGITVGYIVLVLIATSVGRAAKNTKR